MGRGYDETRENSPDGKYAYYNAAPAGTQQIWRMKTDGSDKEQLSFDEYHNWFPRVSPDGKWVVFLSYLPDTDPNDHPPYKRVMLRIMPTAGGAPRVLAWLYGGGDRTDRPCWAPDSRHLVFVSSSGMTAR
jgi:Tol biopolymer transport system component